MATHGLTYEDLEKNLFRCHRLGEAYELVWHLDKFCMEYRPEAGGRFLMLGGDFKFFKTSNSWGIELSQPDMFRYLRYLFMGMYTHHVEDDMTWRFTVEAVSWLFQNMSTEEIMLAPLVNPNVYRAPGWRTEIERRNQHHMEIA